MKTVTQILNEMILENKKEIKKLEEKMNQRFKLEDNYITSIEKNLQKEINKRYELENIIELLIRKVKKITLILSITTIINSISIILINLGR